MLMESRISELEDRLSRLSEERRKQEETASRTLQNNDSAIDSLLRTGIATIQTLIDSPVLALENNARLPHDTGTRAMVIPSKEARACADACTAFGELADAADRYLKDIMAMQLEVIEAEGELAALQGDMDAAASRILGDISEVEELLKLKETELQVAREELESSTREMNALSDKLESNRDKRHILRVGRAAAWIATPFFPPMAGVALAMEAGNLVLKDDKAGLKSSISIARETQERVKEGIAVLRLNEETFQSDLARNVSASEKCRALVDEIKLSRMELVGREEDYQNLKDAAGKFVLWTSELDSKALLLGDSDDHQGIAKATKLLVDEIGKIQGGAFKLICESLRPAPRKTVAAGPFAWLKIQLWI